MAEILNQVGQFTGNSVVFKTIVLKNGNIFRIGSGYIVEIYNLSTKLWSRVANIPHSIGYTPLLLLMSNGDVVCIGGNSDRKIYTYKVEQNIWVNELPDLPSWFYYWLPISGCIDENDYILIWDNYLPSWYYNTGGHYSILWKGSGWLQSTNWPARNEWYWDYNASSSGSYAYEKFEKYIIQETLSPMKYIGNGRILLLGTGTNKYWTFDINNNTWTARNSNLGLPVTFPRMFDYDINKSLIIYRQNLAYNNQGVYVRKDNMITFNHSTLAFEVVGRVNLPNISVDGNVSYKDACAYLMNKVENIYYAIKGKAQGDSGYFKEDYIYNAIDNIPLNVVDIKPVGDSILIMTSNKSCYLFKISEIISNKQLIPKALFEDTDAYPSYINHLNIPKKIFVNKGDFWRCSKNGVAVYFIEASNGETKIIKFVTRDGERADISCYLGLLPNSGQVILTRQRDINFIVHTE